ncbi:MAG TPA: hypothetical protein DD827_02905 [Gammaproteobacteria bacterium]|nr:hypothetical protein [Gammaproteobacteria bacterium]
MFRSCYGCGFGYYSFKPDARQHLYEVKVINLTNGQPISPPGAILHDATYHAWAVGQAASEALEMMAEGGDASALVASQSSNPTFGSMAPIGPGGNQTFEISSDEDATKTYLTVAGMLVNTNDAFSGVTGVSLDGLETGQMRTYNTHAYDAGTEKNDEIGSNLPGPAGGGEGFNATRDDNNPVVTLHGGIVSKDDGYAESALSEAHRFDNAVMRIEVKRL